MESLNSGFNQVLPALLGRTLFYVERSDPLGIIIFMRELARQGNDY